MRGPLLDIAEAPSIADLVCTFGITGAGWVGPHHCHACAAFVDQSCAEFDAAVARGEYDAQGYTPAERKA